MFLKLEDMKRMGSGFVSYYTLREEYLRTRRLTLALRRAAQAVLAEADAGDVDESLSQLRKAVDACSPKRRG